MGALVAWGCLLLGIYRFYELSQKKDELSKSEKNSRIGIGIFMIALGCYLLCRMYFR